MASKKWWVLLLVLILSQDGECKGGAPAKATSGPRARLSDANGGIPCAACTVIAGLIEQLAEIYNVSVAEAASRICNLLPSSDLKEACTFIFNEFLPGIIALLEQKYTPDEVCFGVDLCKNDTGEMCHLFPLPSPDAKSASSNERLKRAVKTAVLARGRPYRSLAFRFPDICNISVIKPICEIFERFGSDHLPVDDLDGDFFSDLQTFRGTSWRGKDCADFDPKIYPGRYTNNDRFVDTNCNGISGEDPDTGRTYEYLYCDGSEQMGTVILGDSAGAHFHIPPSWLNSTELKEEVFKDLIFILENEFDWPMLSYSTGYRNTTAWPNSISGPVTSIYLKLREINRCNHRDYQNIAVNGARSSSMADHIVQSFSRHGKEDNPVFIIFNLVGNDVCSGHHSMSSMTTPQEFYQNNLKTFKYVDSIVAPGSVLIALGLADGRILYEALEDRVHPIGSWKGDVKYPQFYDYLNCLQVSPCFGWMNSNATWRNRTTERAMELNSALKDLVANATFTNFKTVHYFDVPIEKAIEWWEEHGGQRWEMIEPVDGFHPNQLAHNISAFLLWDMIQQEVPSAVPRTNSFNSQIFKIFGDQGGY